jgi:hypothetical protein
VVLAGCGLDAVVVVEEIQRLAPVVDRIEVIQDVDGDGVHEIIDDDSVLVIDPRGSVDKAIRISFIPGFTPERSALDPAAPDPFLELSGAATLFYPLEIERTYFADDPADTSLAGTATVVTYDLRDDFFDPADPPVNDDTLFSPAELRLHLERLDPGLELARAFFIVPPRAPTGNPTRVFDFVPGLASNLGQKSPIRPQDFPCFDPDAAIPHLEIADCIGDVLAAVDANTIGDTLAERVIPHQQLSLGFAPEAMNFVVSMTPEDFEGVEFRTEGFPFRSFERVRSETPRGLIPDTSYEVHALAQNGLVFVPLFTGTQGVNGAFLIPNYSTQTLEALRAAGFTDRELADDTRFAFRTGPVRITGPAHLGDVGVADAPNGVLPIRVEYASPNDGPPTPENLLVMFSAPGAPPSQTLAYSGVNDVIDQSGIVRSAGVTSMTFTISLPPSDFDAEVPLQVRARDGANAFIGEDRIRFHYDSIIPEIDEGSITITNEHRDGRVEQLCLVADCDLAELSLTVEGGSQVTIEVNATHFASACVDSKRTYCFDDLPIGVPPEVEDGEPEVTVSVTDDQGNESDAVTTNLPLPTCTLPPDKFVAADGRRLKTLLLPDGSPVVFRSDGRRLRSSTWDGSRWNTQTIATLPDDSDAVLHRFGQGFDAVIDQDGQPAVCLVDGAIAAVDGEPTATELTSRGQLQIAKQAEDGTWSVIASRGNVRAIGCSITSFLGTLTFAWVEVNGTVGNPNDSRGRWGQLSSAALGGHVVRDDFRIPAGADGGPADRGLTKNLRIEGVGSRLYFAYQAVKPSSALSAEPGEIVVGFTTGPGAQLLHIARGDGRAPAFAITPSTFEIALVDSFAERLAYFRSPLPSSIGGAFSFSTIFTDPLVPLGIDSDGVTTVPEGMEGFAPASPGPEMALSPDGAEVLVSYPRRAANNSQLQNELFVKRVSLTGGTEDRVLEARVGTNPPLQERIAHSIAVGPKGFHVTFRSPDVNRIVFAQERNQFDFGRRQTGCPELWKQTALAEFESEMNLEFINFSNDPSNPRFAWSNLCPEAAPQLVGPGIDLSFPGLRVLNPDADLPEFDFVGQRENLLRDQFLFSELRTGRGLLKQQENVCIPFQPTALFVGNACDPLSGIPFTVPQESLEAPAIRAAPLPSPVGGAKVACDPAGEPCACDGQLVVEPDGSFACATCAEPTFCLDPDDPACPEGAFWDTERDQCSVCLFSQAHYASSTPGVIPDQVTSNEDVACVVCASSLCSVDPTRGQTDCIASSDGRTCSRCPDGSQLLPCGSDVECTVLGSLDQVRCVDAGAWRGRLGAPTDNRGRVCVKLCESDADCPFGRCVDNGDDEGTCVDGEREVPAGTDLACRPIGCDSCWDNSYCETAADCPLNHECSNDLTGFDPIATPTPICIGRPLISRQSGEHLLESAGSAPGVPEAVAALATLRSEIVRAMTHFRIPTRTGANRPFQLDAALSDIAVRLEPSADPARQGRVIVRIELFNVAAGVFVGPPVNSFVSFSPGNVEIEGVYEPHARPRPAGSTGIDLADVSGRPGDGFVGVGFTLVDANLSADIDVVPGVGIPIGGLFEDTLTRRAGRFSGRFLETIVRILGTPGIPRCVFVSDQGRLALLPRDCGDGTSETEELVKVEGDQIRVVLRRCQ